MGITLVPHSSFFFMSSLSSFVFCCFLLIAKIKFQQPISHCFVHWQPLQKACKIQQQYEREKKKCTIACTDNILEKEKFAS